ncbi:MAG: hypothetical protein MK081_16230 [Flavobacteriales bacterium]|nr:hypothetical protein [Flavobacteriales bacterium]
MPGRTFAQEDYRYGFQGQETDDEIRGEGNSVNYKYRMHDARIGRFFAVDPLAPKYPHNSPYAFSENMVIHMVELEGLEAAPYGYKSGGETEEGTIFTQTERIGDGFTAPNGDFVSGGVIDEDLKLNGVVYGFFEESWYALGFELVDGTRYTWDVEKNWYVDSEGEEFVDSFFQSFTNSIGRTVRPAMTMFMDYHEQGDALFSFKEAFEAHGGSIGEFVYDGFKQSIVNVLDGGHEGYMTLGSFLFGAQASGPLLFLGATEIGLGTGLLGSIPKASIPGFRSGLGFSTRVNYFSYLAYLRHGLDDVMPSRVTAPLLVQINYNVARAFRLKPPQILRSKNFATVQGRLMQSDAMLGGGLLFSTGAAFSLGPLGSNSLLDDN